MDKKLANQSTKYPAQSINFWTPLQQLIEPEEPSNKEEDRELEDRKQEEKEKEQTATRSILRQEAKLGSASTSQRKQVHWADQQWRSRMLERRERQKEEANKRKRQAQLQAHDEEAAEARDRLNDLQEKLAKMKEADDCD